MFVFLIPLTIGIFIGLDASKRGMNAWGWGIGVFLLLIVFLPLYFVLRKPLLTDQTPYESEILDDEL